MAWGSDVEGFSGISSRKHDPITVMTYSHDGYGLGHMRRNSTIAASLVLQMPHSSVLMLVGCPVGAFFELPPGVDFIKGHCLPRQSSQK
jgi:predicted glycosyltransferase